MKKLLICLLLTALALCCASAEGDALPSGVLDLLDTRYQDWSIASQCGAGDETQGQFAFVMKYYESNALCIVEKRAEDAAYRFTLASGDAVYQGDAVPKLYIDTDGASLFYTYQNTKNARTLTYHAQKDAAGRWGAVMLTAEASEYNKAFFRLDGDLLRIGDSYEDENDNVLRQGVFSPAPAAWLSGARRLSTFDIDDFPTRCDDERIAKYAAHLLPDGCAVRRGRVTRDALLMQAVDASGVERLYICRYEAGAWQTTQSAALPDGAYVYIYDEGFSVEWSEGDDWLSYAFAPDGGGRYVISNITAKDWFSIQKYSLTDDMDEKHYGRLLVGDIATLDFGKLPRTCEEAVALLDRTGMALVVSDDPARRLNLRAQPSPDGESLGKYYSGTPVDTLETRGEWTRVQVGGIEGWMMTKFLAFDEAMDRVKSAFPELILLEVLPEGGAPIYASPSADAKVVGNGAQYGWYDFDIIGAVGEEWYHILFKTDGTSGYIRQDLFWPGNG